jgi:hypothetical protein
MYHQPYPVLLLVLTLIFVIVLALVFLVTRWRAYKDREQAWQESERDNLVQFSPEAQRRWGRRTSDIPPIRTPR